MRFCLVNPAYLHAMEAVKTGIGVASPKNRRQRRAGHSDQHRTTQFGCVRDVVESKPAGVLSTSLRLSLGYSKPVVRSAAYNLLCAVANAFELEVQGQLCESPGLCIPANNTLFIVSLSCGLSKRQSHVTLELLEECITGKRTSQILLTLRLSFLDLRETKSGKSKEVFIQKELGYRQNVHT